MLLVGLTGGLATGKSNIGRILAQLGCHLIRADELGHQALDPGGGAHEGVIAEFGQAILKENGTIDRRALAALVFEDPERLAWLNTLVHPIVIRREQELIAQFRAADPNGIVVVEAAILVETGSHKRFQKLIVAVCSEQEQVERAMRRDGLTREEVLARLRRQMPLQEKVRFADYVIDTSGSKEQTYSLVKQVYDSLRSITQ